MNPYFKPGCHGSVAPCDRRAPDTTERCGGHVPADGRPGRVEAIASEEPLRYTVISLGKHARVPPPAAWATPGCRMLSV